MSLKNLINIKESENKGHFFHKLLFSYVTVLIIPVILILMLSYFYNESYLKPSIKNVESLQLDIIKSNTESLFDQIDLIALNLMQNGNIGYIKNLTKDKLISDYEYIENLYDIEETLLNYSQLNSFIHSIYIYNQDTSLLIKSKGAAENVSESSLVNSDISWIEEYNEGKRITSSRTIGEESMAEIFSIIYPIYYKNINGLIVINIDKKELFSYLDDENLNESSFILVHDDRILYNSLDKPNTLPSSTLYNILDKIKSKENNGHFIYDINENDKYAVTYSNMKSLYGEDIILISLTPISILFKQIKSVTTLTLILSIIIIILGIIISIFVAGKLYSPMKKMLYDIKSQIKINSAGNENEFEIVSTAIDELLKQEDEVNKMFEMNKANLKEAHVLELIMGNENENMGQYCQLLDYSAVIIISIDDGFSEMYSKQEQYYYKSLFKMTCEQVVNMMAKGYGAVIENNKIVLIISMKERNRDILKTIADNMLKEIIKINNFSFTLGVSKIYAGSSSIRQSYMEANETLRYNFLFNKGSIIYYSELDHNTIDYYYPQNIDRQIINHLNTNAYDEICEVINNLFNDLRAQTNIQYENIMGIINQIITTTIKSLISNDINLSDIFGDNYNIYKTLYSNKTIDDMEVFLLKFFKKITEYNKTLINLDSRYVSEVVELIENNYTDSNLDITWVSEKLGISYSHLRKIFSDNLNVNFPDYVNNLRINMAKGLLLDSDLTIRDIALKTGFNNAQSFNRNFKKYEGITPSEYRKKIWL